MVLASPSVSCYKYEPIKLISGFNEVSIITDYTDLSKKDITIDLINNPSGSYNFLGFSAINKKNLNNLKFYDSNGNMKEYKKAVKSKWIEPIEDRTYLKTYDGYWIKSYLAVKMVIPNVKGENIGNTFNWADLRFSNGTTELNITEAINSGWTTGVFQYWGCDRDAWGSQCDTNPNRWTFLSISSGNLSSWQGYFVKSNKDNIYMITNNQTKNTRKCLR